MDLKTIEKLISDVQRQEGRNCRFIIEKGYRTSLMVHKVEEAGDGDGDGRMNIIIIVSNFFRVVSRKFALVDWTEHLRTMKSTSFIQNKFRSKGNNVSLSYSFHFLRMFIFIFSFFYSEKKIFEFTKDDKKQSKIIFWGIHKQIRNRIVCCL